MSVANEGNVVKMDDLMDRLRGVTGGKLDYTNTPNSLRLASADHIEQLVATREELEAERDAALVALFECMVEIDAYIQQEYPPDHPVHERYRQRDYAANPTRIFLRDRPDALVKARTTLAELKGQKDGWKCPINHPNCEENCGNYGCGN